MDAKRDPGFKKQLFEQFARVGQALSNGARLEMIELLAQRERSVEELARMAGVSVANASQHLRVLRAAGMVESRRDGLFVFYRLGSDRVFALWQALREAGQQRSPEVARLVRGNLAYRETVEAVSLAELRRKLASGEVLVLDVRPADEFEVGHIPGARNIPLAELERRMRWLPKDVEIVAYCRGPFCVLSDDAIEFLRARGRKALRLEAGYPDWRAMGWPCATGVDAALPKGHHA